MENNKPAQGKVGNADVINNSCLRRKNKAIKINGTQNLQNLLNLQNATRFFH